MEENSYAHSLKGWGSTAIHGGHRQDPSYAHQVPIYASSTYVYDTAEQGMRRFSGEEEGFIYSRWGNPTIREAEEKITALETFGLNVKAKAILHSSGMAAITTMILSQLKAGDRILTHYSLYGGTDELLNKILPAIGITAVIADLRDPAATEEILKKEKDLKLLYLETPANPTLQCVYLETLASLGKKYGLKVACDNTFATPYLQQPFKYPVDFIVHSRYCHRWCGPGP